MTEEEASRIIHMHGWTPRTRRLRKQSYLYAYKKKQGKLEERYIAPITELPNMTEGEIVDKIS